jgi:hypothetical protein
MAYKSINLDCRKVRYPTSNKLQTSADTGMALKIFAHVYISKQKMQAEAFLSDLFLYLSAYRERN